jgi:hypothetical protein
MRQRTDLFVQHGSWCITGTPVAIPEPHCAAAAGPPNGGSSIGGAAGPQCSGCGSGKPIWKGSAGSSPGGGGGIIGQQKGGGGRRCPANGGRGAARARRAVGPQVRLLAPGL